VELSQILSNKKILVIGDSILDRYIYGKVYRVSPEAPVPVVVKKNDSYFLGGAANVAQNITSFGSKCTLLTVAGKDQAHEDLKNLCREKNIDCISIIDSTRPTTIKTRIIGNNHQIVRIDEEITEKISFEIQSQIIELLNKIIQDFDAVILQDYDKGMLTSELVAEIISMSNLNGKKTIIDPKDPDISKYSCCTLIKPNLSEFKTIAGISLHKDISQKDIVKIAKDKIAELGIDSFLITMSEKGMLYVDKNQDIYEPGLKIEVSDVSGAGDTVSAVITLCLSADLDKKDCLKLANTSGSLVCQVSGAAQITPEILFNYISRKNPLFSLSDGTQVFV
jgi:D-beta-D-heptose 7-phosphate kinase/D-beta-D-heptose 1-phosphate adenosyltransferase